jgi:hypothetical protein
VQVQSEGQSPRTAPIRAQCSSRAAFVMTADKDGGGELSAWVPIHATGRSRVILKLALVQMRGAQLTCRTLAANVYSARRKISLAKSPRI